ncbi:unnamed protein product, partial [Didymodactylos carnosus]
SGSTAFPKPIYLDNKRLLNPYYIYKNFNEDNYKPNDTLLSMAPFFYEYGFRMTFIMWQNKGIYALPLTRTVPPSPHDVLASIKSGKINIFGSAPAALEQLIDTIKVENNNDYSPLKQLRYISFGGAPCPDELCKNILDNGIELRCEYGSTETGPCMFYDFESPLINTRLKRMRIPNIRKPYLTFIPESDDSNIKELVLLPNDPFKASNISNRSDALIQGRIDDTLIHTNGTKTNAIPIELTIREHLIVKQVAVIGHDRFCTSAIIQLNIDEASKYQLNEIDKQVWMAIEAANRNSPKHSRILKEMYTILPMNKYLPVTDKGNIMRKKILVEYEDIINDMYNKFLNNVDEHQQQSGT